MTIAKMFEQSAVLTVLGMTVVFAFLWVMIICLNMTAKLVHKMGWDKDVRQPLNTAIPPKNTSWEAGPEITAAITAAVIEYRRQVEAS